MIGRPSLLLLSSQQTDPMEIVNCAKRLCSGFFCFLLNHPSAHRLLIVHHSRAVQASFNFVTQKIVLRSQRFICFKEPIVQVSLHFFVSSKKCPGKFALYLLQEKNCSGKFALYLFPKFCTVLK